MPKWLEVLTRVAPVIMAFIPSLAQLAPIIVGAMAVAEQIPGATGAQKKALVQQLVSAGAQATNAAAGKTVIDPAVAADTAGHAIDTTINIVNLVHQATGG